jgi:hypothetical protein
LETTTTTNNSNKLEIENLLILPESTSKQDSLFSDLFSPFEINNKPVINPLAQTFSIDIDPFSSESTSTNSSFTSKTQITDPFGFNIAPTKTTAANLYFNPFQDNFTDNFSKKMSNDETEPISILDFSKADDLNGSTPFDQDDQDKNNKQEEEENKLFFYKPSIPLNNPQLTFVEQNRDDDDDNNEDNIDNAFIAYSNEHHTHDKVETDEMTIISNELADTKLKLKEILEEEVNTTDELPVDETTPENNDRPFNVVDTAISDSDSDSDSIEFNGHKLTNKFNMDNVNIKQFNIGDDEEEEEEVEEEKKVTEAKEPLETIQIRSTLTASPESVADDSTKSNSVKLYIFKQKLLYLSKTFFFERNLSPTTFILYCNKIREREIFKFCLIFYFCFKH